MSKKCFTLLLLGFLLNLSLFSQVQDSVHVIGEEVVCQGNKSIYTVSEDFIHLEWNITGSSYYSKINKGIEVYWSNPGQGRVVAKGTYNNGNTVNSFLDITINTTPKASILDDNGGIYSSKDDFTIANDSLPHLDSIVQVTCSPACELFPANYTSQFPSNVSHLWVANEGTIIGSNNQPSVVVKWNSTGSPNLKLYVTNNEGCIDSTEICISVLKKPKADFTVADGCIASVLYFNNQSENGNKYKWDFGDGSTSDLENPTHSYSTSGDFEVTQFVYNLTNCVDTIVKTVHIEDSYAPVINCVGPACKGSTVLYSAEANCSDFLWNVTGGTVTAGQGSKTIEVLWDQNVSKGTIELEVTGCDEEVCVENTIISVALIQPNLPIIGETKPCRYSEYIYSLDPIPGSNYTWSVEGGYILGQNNASGVKVRWQSPGTGKVSVSYDNPTLGCSGTADLTVNIKQKSFVSNPYSACANRSIKISTNSNSGLWNVLGGEIEKTEAGKAFIKAGFGERLIINYENQDPNYCTSNFSRNVNIIPPVPSLDYLQGDTIVCIDKVYQYNSSLFDLNKYRIEWNIENGDEIISPGNTSEIKWSSGQKKLSANLVSRQSSQCKGDTVYLHTAQATEYNYDFNIDGNFCVNSEINLAATIEGSPTKELDLDYKWSITPSEAASIVSGQYTERSRFQLNNIPGNATITLEVSSCDAIVQTIEKQITINQAQNANISIPEPFCEGTNTTVTTNAHEVESWEFNGSKSFGDKINISSSGKVILNYKDAQGCSSSAITNADQKPLPKVLSTTGNHTVCEGSSVNRSLITLNATTYSFSWSKNNNVLTSETQPILNVNEIGNYQLEVMNEYGCINNKDFTITEIDCSGGGSGGTGSGGTGGGGSGGGTSTCTATGNISFTASASCTTIEYTNTSSSNATNLTLNFGDGTTHTFTSPGEKVTHQYTLNIGVYSAKLVGNLPGIDENGVATVCTRSASETFNIPLESNFRQLNKCNGLELYFEELAVWLPGDDVTQWHWNFGDPTSGSSNLSTDKKPSHVFSSEGTYDVTLTVSNATCSNTYTKSITVSKPIIDFDVDEPICINTPVQLTVSDVTLNSSVYHEFYFGTDTIKNLDEAKYTFQNPGAHTVGLIATNNLGCTSEMLVNVNVNSPLGGAAISPNTPLSICEGDSVLLSAPSSLSYEWSNLSSTQNIYVKQEGTYSVTIRDNFGCIQTTEPVPVEINFKPIPFLFATGAPGFCYNTNNVNVDGLPSSYNYKWFINGVIQSSPYQYISSPEEGDFVCEVTNDETGCIGISAPYKLKKHPIESLNIISDKNPEICNGDFITLTANVPQDSIIYTWRHNKSHNPSVKIGESGMYFVEAKNIYGCKATQSFKINILSQPNGDDVISGCFEACDKTELTLAGVAGYQNDWYKEDNSNWSFIGGGNSKTVTETGTYRAIIYNSYYPQCSDTSNVSYVMFEDCAELILDPILKIDPDTNFHTICLGDPVLFKPQLFSDPVYLEFKELGTNVYQELYKIANSDFTENPQKSGYYRLRADETDTVLYSDEIFIEVIEPTNPGEIQTNKIKYCEGDTISLTLIDTVGEFITWEQLSEVSSLFETLNDNSNPFSIVAQESNITIRAKVKNGICPVDYAEKTIDVYDIPNPGFIESSYPTTICANENNVQLNLKDYEDINFQWLAEDHQGQPFTQFTTNGATLTAQNLTHNVEFIARSGIAECGFTEARILIQVSQPIEIGNVDFDTTYCENQRVAIKLNNLTANSVAWNSNTSFNNFTSYHDSLVIDKVPPGEFSFTLSLSTSPCPILDTILSFKVDSLSKIGSITTSIDSICGPSEIEIVALDITGTIQGWEFSENGGLFNPIAINNDTISFFKKANTDIVLGVKNGVCPITYDTINLDIDELIEYSVSQIYCESSDSIHFNFPNQGDYTLAFSIGTNDTIVELNSSNNYSFPIIEIGRYNFKSIKNYCSQDITDTTWVVAFPSLSVDTIISPFCFGYSSAEVEAEIKANPFFKTGIEWRDESNTNIVGSSPKLTDIGGGKYFAETYYLDLPTCTSLDSIFITQPLPFDTLGAFLIPETCENFNDGALEIYFNGGTPPYQFSLHVEGVNYNSKIDTILENGFKASNLIPGIALATVVDAKGCTYYYEVRVKEALAWDIQVIEQGNLLCADSDTGRISLNILGPKEVSTVVWPDGLQSTSLIRNDLPVGDGYVKVITEDHCVDSTYFNITSPQPITITFDSLKNTCIDEATGIISATANGGVGNFNYLWSNGVSDSTINNLAADTYEVIVTDENGCIAKMKATIDEKEKPIAEFEFAQPDCGANWLDIKINATIGDVELDVDGDDVDIDLKGNDLFGLSIFDFKTYPITGKIDNDGCIIEISDTVVFRKQPKALFAIDESQGLLGFNYLFENQSENADYYRWTFGGASDTSYNETPGILSIDIRNILNPRVCLDVGTLLGCEDSFCINLDVENARVDILIPNTFTPNFDGTNDTFKPVLVGVLPTEYQLEIKNKWGKTIFVSQEPDHGWDGTYKGSKAPIGNYAFFLKFKDELTGKEYYKSGSILLLN